MAKKRKKKAAKKKVTKKKKTVKKKKKKPAKKKAKRKTKPKTKKKPGRPSNKKRSRAAPRKARGRKKTRKTAEKTRKAKGKRGKRHTPKQRARLLDKYHELRKGGLSAEKAAKKVGVSYITLLKWEKKSGKKFKTKRGPSSKKRSRTAKTAAALTLVTPSGFRIEGITTKDLIKVLRGLK